MRWAAEQIEQLTEERDEYARCLDGGVDCAQEKISLRAQLKNHVRERGPVPGQLAETGQQHETTLPQSLVDRLMQAVESLLAEEYSKVDESWVTAPVRRTRKALNELQAARAKQTSCEGCRRGYPKQDGMHSWPSGIGGGDKRPCTEQSVDEEWERAKAAMTGESLQETTSKGPMCLCGHYDTAHHIGSTTAKGPCGLCSCVQWREKNAPQQGINRD